MENNIADIRPRGAAVLWIYNGVLDGQVAGILAAGAPYFGNVIINIIIVAIFIYDLKELPGMLKLIR